MFEWPRRLHIPAAMRFIIVTGGVYSGIGKGVVSASLATLLDGRVVNIKWDGYHNHNPGTLSPIEHGECFVTADGAEVDLDFGHYERFSGRPSLACHSITRGKLSETIARLEREGQRYEGKTIQEVPHMRNLLVEMIERAAAGANARHDSAGSEPPMFGATAGNGGADVCIFEIGGTVGDDEASLALHAAVALTRQFGRDNVKHVHVAPLCYAIDSHEPKTKPIQRSLADLQARGIFADLVVVRTERPDELDAVSREKISAATGIPFDAIIEGPHLSSIYGLPGVFIRQSIDRILNTRTTLPPAWELRANALANVTRHINITIYGKYTVVSDSYVSIVEALTHAGASLGIGVNVSLVAAGDTVPHNADGLLVPGGYGERGVEAKIDAIQHARTSGLPFLGICYGMQLAVIEYARNVCGLNGANTTEVYPETPHPVVAFLDGQSATIARSGTQRLGAHEIKVLPGTVLEGVYPADSRPIIERYRHRYEVNPAYHQALIKAGMKISAVDAAQPELVAAVELIGPNFFVGVQYHPEFNSCFLQPNPVFVAFVRAAHGR